MRGERNSAFVVHLCSSVPIKHKQVKIDITAKRDIYPPETFALPNQSPHNPASSFIMPACASQDLVLDLSRACTGLITWGLRGDSRALLQGDSVLHSTRCEY